MKEYLRFFRIPFILIGVLAVLTVAMAVANGVKTAATSSVTSVNTERTTTERVFDYADVLETAQEDALRTLISEAEKETQCDIVLVTLNETLEEYVKPYEEQLGPVAIDYWVQVYADNFYEEHKFGYNEAYGDGVIFVDNWFRESDGYVHNCFSTTGKAEAGYSNSMINKVIGDVNAVAEADPYTAYVSYVENVRRDMAVGGSRTNEITERMQPPYILIASLVIALIFLAINWSSKKGKKTTTDRTYVVGGNPTFRRREDRFLYKNVTKRKIEKSSSSGGSGGGGHHRSASGRSQGGGVGRR